MLLNLFYLAKLQLDGCRPTENRHRHSDARLLVVHFLDVAVEVGERTVLDANHLAYLEKRLWPWLFDAFLHLRHDLFYLAGRERASTISRAANEAGHFC